MLTAEEWGAGHTARKLGEVLATHGYEVSPLDSGHGVLATKRGHSAGPFLPWSDFVFIVDIEAAGITDPLSFDEYHEGVRAFGESKMKVPRLLRYRVPNSVTFGVSASGLTREMVDYAHKSRHAVNSGEKNAVYLLDLSNGELHSQGLEHDRLNRYGGTWTPNVNPANRLSRLLVNACLELIGPTLATDNAG